MDVDVLEARARARRLARLREAPMAEYHLLLLVTLGLVAFGLIMVYSASSGVAVVQGENQMGALLKQAVYAIAGTLMMAVAAWVPYRRWRPAVPVIMLISLVLLVAVLVPHIGLRLNGASRWIAVGPLTIQPSEVAKLAVVLFTCQVLAARRRPPGSVKELVNPVGAVVTATCVLVLAEPDLGTTIALAIMVGGVLVVAGTRLRLLVGTVAMGSVAALLGISQNSYMKDRLLTFVNPWHDAAGAGYQNAQALIALGSGGIFGKGLGQGTQKIYYLPESPSDMIAAVIGEELGLIGILATALAFAVFAVLGFRIAMRCREPFGKYLATGITCLVAGQAVVNLGAVLGFLPLTGVPLPLISSGGSSLVVFMTMAGILLNIAQSGTPPRRPAARRGRTLPDDDAPKPKPAQVKRLRPATAASADSRRRNSRPRRTRAGGGSRARG
jgi:cell division protein FtsW